MDFAICEHFGQDQLKNTLHNSALADRKLISSREEKYFRKEANLTYQLSVEAQINQKLGPELDQSIFYDDLVFLKSAHWTMLPRSRQASWEISGYLGCTS